MEIRKVLLAGGSGFLGTAVARRLAADGVRVTVPTRRLAHAKHLLVLPTVEVVQADVHDEAALGQLVRGQDAVVNLVGILHSRPGSRGSPYGPDFARAHVALPRSIARACAQAGVQRLLHVSALKAAPDAPSAYLRSKAAGEQAIAGGTVQPTIFRPSVIFGRGDGFINLFAGLARRFPLIPLACPQARFQPVWVGDVAELMCEALRRPESAGCSYELCGPRIYTLRELVRTVGALCGHPRPVIGLPDAASRVQALVLEHLPGKLMTRDNLASMRTDSVCGGCALPFGRVPAPLEALAPSWLAPGRR
ncbi:MAG: complex I NDUFA9 subunit family protein [Rhodocyclaceae bacterium]